ncbi:MAG: SDR family NAD(P)-dependent oxidoreductase [Actinomycetota bacterium]|nr:SDR family NAD(P)-dependent oxidoreductase [Acidimicrobiia bacterium]MDQ3294014.1 SDR family NAD(P)-dependent oxidoreductase [Actinomycetota bacterium]
MGEPTVLVTGASSGIGLATVEALAERGARVVAGVRREESAAMVEERMGLLDLAVTTALLDVTDDGTMAKVIAEHSPDVLVNNAGDAALGEVLELDDDEIRGQFDVHVFAAVRLIRLAVPHMRGLGEGRIVNVSSLLSGAPLPFTGWYAAAKAAMHTINDVLRVELEPYGVDVVLVDCGAIDTPAWASAGADVAGDGDPASGPARRRWQGLTRLARPFFGDAALAGRTVAKAALDECPRAVYRTGFGAHALALADLAPSAVRDRVTRSVFDL